MGIPHLITHLRPYAVAGDLTGRSVVIDGPAFAYHIFHLCLATTQDAKNPFEAAPTYALLGKTALQWLDALRSRDIKLKGIFFDGFLPASKRNVRHDRLKAYTKQLCGYQEAWPQNLPLRLEARKPIGNVELFAPRSLIPGLSKIPAAPFLVPAVIEALNSSPVYRGITKIVPGEADLFCARYLREHGGIVLTSDSDLLVHDLGSDGSVCFFGDVLLVSTRGVMSIRCIQYRLDAIASRLELPEGYGLKALAYEISLDAHASFPQLLQRATKLQSVMSSKNTYAEFCSQYTPLPLRREDNEETPLRKQLEKLDPRISEYILQYPRFASVVGLSGDRDGFALRGRTEVDIFMPFLLDCPVKTSAWEISTAVRQLAYGLLNLVVPENQSVLTVLENRRVQHEGGGREWQLPTSEEMQHACENMIATLRAFQARSSGTTNNTIWHSITLKQDLAWATSMDKTGLAASLIDKSSTGHSVRLSWDIVHFTAQVHGSFYSFRILQQVLDVLLACEVDVPQYIKTLYEELSNLPKLDKLHSIDEIKEWLASPEARETLLSVRSFLGIQSSDPKTSKKEKKEKKKRKRDGAAPESSTPSKRPANIFELLGNE